MSNAPQPTPLPFDETKDAHGRVRTHWKRLLDGVAAIGNAELDHRWEKAQQLIHENGISFNAYGDPDGRDRPWSLSPMPMLISPDDWTQITRGLTQRMRLLSALLADLYGPQRVIMEGHLPPELVFAHPGFLRAAHGLPAPQGGWLTLYAADLVRAPDGRFQVLKDATQVPSGAGYALENRIVISRILPEIFRECSVERLAHYFRTLRESLRALAPHHRDNPRIVLLTPGPYNATYFEQAYLAQYLGLTLVSGGDLVVRDDRVCLKTLSGLHTVDVILRRVNDDFCDPLELRPESMLGVPGLMQAVRSGNVAVASPLGSGLAQTPAFLPYLPACCKQLLGEELAMPSVRTWWCGDPSAFAEVLARIDDVVIKPAFPSPGTKPLFTAAMTRADRDALVAEMRARPSAFVAQEHAALSKVPTMLEGALAPRSVVVRCFASIGKGDAPALMPGGLARVAVADSGGAVSMQHGARSADVWVVSRERVSEFSLLPPSNVPLELSRGGGDLPSRVADNLYWLGRYAERAEGVARLARVVGVRLADLTSDADLERSTELAALFTALAAQTQLLCSADIPEETVTTLREGEARLVAAVRDTTCVGSVAAVVGSTLRAGRVVRDRISLDTWRVLASLDEELASIEERPEADTIGTLVNVLNRVVGSLASFSGLVMESMTRGQSWCFLDIGRRIERASTLITLLRATATRRMDREGSLLEAILDVADSGMTYRRRYLATLQVPPVVDLLLCDETNPRSVLYQVRALGDDFRALPPAPGARVNNPQLRHILALRSELELAEIERLCAPDASGARPLLDQSLRRIGALVPALSESLSNGYLNHATISRSLRQDEAARLQLPPLVGTGELP